MSSVVQSGSKTNQDEKSADFTLRTDLLRLGGAYILTISKFKKNEMVFSSKYKAASLDELDDVSDRGVRAVILGTQVKKDTRVGEVSTRDENKMQTRVRSFNTRYFGFGAASLMNMGNSKVAYNIAFGHFWEVTPRTQIKLVGEFFATSDWTTYLADAQLGLNLFLNDEDSSPYIGAGLGVAGSVDFLGPIDDEALRTEYAACDLFALPSRKEGFGLVYLEAMTHGKPRK